MVNNFEVDELESVLNMPNDELSKLKAQKHPFKLISGDIMEHYPYGRLFDFESNEHDLNRFNERDISPTGVLCGKKVKISSGLARDIEKDFDDEINADGARRYAWVFPEDIEGRHKPIEAQYEMNFTLPKGSYATVLIEEIAKRKIN